MTTVAAAESVMHVADSNEEAIQRALAVLNKVTGENAKLHEEIIWMIKREEELYRQVVQLETSLIKQQAQNARWQKSKFMRLQRSYWQLLQRLKKRPNLDKGNND